MDGQGEGGRAPRRGWIASAVGVALLLALAAWCSLENAASIAFNPVNGHYQNFNAAARLLEGEVPFRDFPAYLGLGPLLVPMPLFAALGGTLMASNLAWDFVSVAMLGLSFYVAMRLCRWPPAVAWAAALALSALPWPMARGNESAIGIRSFVPFAAAGVFVLLSRWRARGGRDVPVFAVAGAVAGTAALWSNDYGLPTAAAFSVAFLACHMPARGRLAAVAAFLAAAVGTAVLLLAAATAGDPLAWARFNFGGVLADQFWYFNPAAAAKTYGLADIPLSAWLVAAPNAALWLRWAVLRRRDPSAAALALLCGAATGGAFLSVLAGSYEARYFLPLWRLTLATLPFAAFLLAAAVLRRRTGGLRARLDRDPILQGILVAAALGVGGWAANFTAAGGYRHASTADDVAAPELGGKVAASYAPALELARSLRRTYDAEGIPADRRILSTYATALARIAGSRQTEPDYVIHALGDAGRARFAAALGDGYRNVETMSPDLLLWATWNVRTSWEFHRGLFEGWKPVSRTPWSLIWARRTAPLPAGPALSCRVVPGEENGFVALEVTGGEGAEPWWAEVVADLDTDFRPSGVPLVGTHRLLEAVEGRAGEVAARRRGSGTENTGLVTDTWTTRLADGPLAMPVRTVPGASSWLSLRSWPEGRSAVRIAGCTARAVAPVSETVLPWTGPRGGEVALASAAFPPQSVSFPTLHDGVAHPLGTADPLAPLAVRVGDEVVFPKGERGRVLMRDFGLLVVAAPEGGIPYPVPSVTVVPREP